MQLLGIAGAEMIKCLYSLQNLRAIVIVPHRGQSIFKRTHRVGPRCPVHILCDIIGGKPSRMTIIGSSPPTVAALLHDDDLCALHQRQFILPLCGVVKLHQRRQIEVIQLLIAVVFPCAGGQISHTAFLLHLPDPCRKCYVIWAFGQWCCYMQTCY